MIISVYTYIDYCNGVTEAFHPANKPLDVQTVSKITEILLPKEPNVAILHFTKNWLKCQKCKNTYFCIRGHL